MENNVRDGIELARPRTLEERAALARLCAERLGLTVPVLVDGMQNTADRAYGAWPERLYVLEPDGRIGYQGGKGPYGFDPRDLERYLVDHA